MKKYSRRGLVAFSGTIELHPRSVWSDQRSRELADLTNQVWVAR